ncbi:type I restriction-modification system endonuclease [Dokdonella soli]|uniref:Type I restriction-modification system endonuclease n=1 Tax=Dokdonella soli TaxID=529810 RepID=A0ABN1IX02_9GAMM
MAGVSNFSVLRGYEEQLWRLGALGERYFAEDPNTCLIKLRQFAELLAQTLAAKSGLYLSPIESRQESQLDLLRRLRGAGVLPNEPFQMFDAVRRLGNDANHALHDEHRSALQALKFCWQLGVWFHRTFGDPEYRSGPFIPPSAPRNESEELRAELERLSQAVAADHAANAQLSAELAHARNQLSTLAEERELWEQIALEADRAKAELTAQLARLQAQSQTTDRAGFMSFAQAAGVAASKVHLDEADTRELIDQQLREAGWEADSVNLRFNKGTRPARNRNLAIAEWPTDSGPADYVLFAGLTPIATVEAKRHNLDVSAALQQAKRYSRGLKATAEVVLPEENWGSQREYRVPFVFSTNGRPYLRQLEAKSGIWFCDLRRADNLLRPLNGWYTPDGLSELLKRDEDAAHAALAQAPFDYGFTLRPYQQEAIRTVEHAIAEGQAAMLLAMATGTGKTKTCIALIYRLLKTQRFRRILFLVDRSALGEQAANAFKDTRMESLQTFADIFGIKELDEQTPDGDTKVHLATVQGMVQRVMYASDDNPAPPVDAYDCIVVDECHRGYLLDRELSEGELAFRNHDDYISKYRRVLDHFDAVKVGLTATPALHTSQIFGAPIFTYSYREAVIDDYLVDYEPPYQIRTKLAADGITWQVGDVVEFYDVRKARIDLFEAPDEIKIAVDEFNWAVITEAFNRVVCEVLADELDPTSQRKTLIFCVNNDHADLVVTLLKKALAHRWGTVDDDAVIKITGAADKPLHLIRRYKNERNPNIAVTVDLLTTGIDVPEICNLVFLRRINSRILFDQMLGRATRLCTFDDGEQKESFRVFDAVQLFEAIGDMTDMRPVVVDPKIGFGQLIDEMIGAAYPEYREIARDQFLAKLQRKKRHLSDRTLQDFETCAGMSPAMFVDHLKKLPITEVAAWFTAHPGLAELLDRKGDRPRPPVLISRHEDELVEVARGYGSAQRPQDYLQQFRDFVTSQGNAIPALTTVLTRPRELTRKQLRELKLALDAAGYTETHLDIAWRETTNHDIAASIVGYIRQAAIGDPLKPFGERVDNALHTLLAARAWTGPQRDWLKKIAAQTKANVVVDRAAIDDPDQLFRSQGGGFQRLDKLFNGQLQDVLDDFNDALWATPQTA